MTPDLSADERERLELERIEDLVTTARKLVERAGERLSIETSNHRRMRILATDARIILSAAHAVLERL